MRQISEVDRPKTSQNRVRVGDAKQEGDEAEAMRTLRNVQQDAAQKVPGHFETVKGATQKGECDLFFVSVCVSVCIDAWIHVYI